MTDEGRADDREDWEGTSRGAPTGLGSRFGDLLVSAGLDQLGTVLVGALGLAVTGVVLIFVGVVAGAVFGGAFSGLTLWRRRRRRQPTNAEATLIMEIVVGIYGRLRDAIANDDRRVGHFLRTSVLPYLADKLAQYLADGALIAVQVEIAIVELTTAHTIDVLHGHGTYAQSLQGAGGFYVGQQELREVLAEKAGTLFPGGGYACIPCSLVAGRTHFLAIATSVPFSQRKKRLLLKHVAAAIESVVHLLSRHDS